MRRTDSRADRAASNGTAQSPAGSADPAGAPVRAQSGSNERFRMLFERASVGIISVGADGRAVEANPAIERMLGYGPGELVGVSFTEFTHPEDLDVSKGLYQELLDGQRPSYQYEKRYVRKDGEVIWVRVTVWSDASAAESSQVAIAMIEDITQSKIADRELQEQRRPARADHRHPARHRRRRVRGPRARDAGDRRAGPGAHARRGRDDQPDRGRRRASRGPRPGSPRASSATAGR